MKSSNFNMLMRPAILYWVLISFYLGASGCEPVRELIESGTDRVLLTENDIVNGLKQALEIGAAKAGERASEEGGFSDNPRLHIPFPENIQRVEETLRGIGLNNLVDDFVLRLNRSAELAAAEAAPVFIDAIRNITIRDGMEILHGDDNAATQYLYQQTASQLEAAFRPVIDRAMEASLATSYWENITNRYNQIPFVENVDTDLTGYTTARAVEGLFVLIENEEREIRNNPSARVTDLMRRVFREQDAS